MHPRDEAGFTLIEVLLAVTILGLIMAAIGSGLVVVMSTADETNARIAGSANAQVAAAYFVSDVQSATELSTTESYCATSATRLVSMRWSDPSTATQNSVTWGTRTDGSQRQLVRVACGDSGGETVVSVSLAATGPTVTCTPSPCGSSSWRVRMVVTEEDQFEFSLEGLRRIWKETV